jgi:streptogrisin D
VSARRGFPPGARLRTGLLVAVVSVPVLVPGVAVADPIRSTVESALATAHTTSRTEEHGLSVPTDDDGVLLGGDSMSDGKIICSAGFVVERAGQPYVLTAGHCTAGLPTWQDVGPSVVSAFPGTDFGLVRDDDADAAGDVDLYDGTAQPITSVGTAKVGERVCASGQTTQVTCGRVTAVDATVDYGDGDVVRGLIATNVHTDHGDSGGPLFDGSIGLGVVSGGDGTTDYFQPIAPVLARYDLSLAVS